MKRTIIIATLMITALSVRILGQTTDQNSKKDEKAKKEVMALVNVYLDALVKRDAETIDRILSEDCIVIMGQGLPSGKFMLLRGLRETPSDAPRLEAINIDEYLRFFRVHNETVVVAVKTTLKWQGSREELSKKWKWMPKRDDFMLTLTAVKKNAAWQIVSIHESDFVLDGQESKPLPKD